MTTDEVVEHLQAVIAADQIVVRAMLVQMVKAFSDAAEDPALAKRQMLQNMHHFIDVYQVPGWDETASEKARELARMNIDVLLSP